MVEEGFLNEFCSTIRNELDKDISEKILEGFEVQDEIDINRLAAWFAGVVERMDNQLPVDIRAKIMKSMGYGCAIMHNEHIKVKQRRDKFNSLEAYIEYEKKNPHPGYSVSGDGDRLLIAYDPEAMKTRCYCAPFKTLESDKRVSLTYCLCSAGHIECIWRHVTGKPVTTEVLCSCMSGDDTCKFEVNLNPL